MMLEAGLVLEGGGMRGVYTAGVLDFLLDKDIHFRHVYGVSAGACHACSYLSKQRGRAVRTIVDFIGDKHYAGLYSLLTTGDFFGVEMIYDTIPNRLLPYDYDTYRANDSRLHVVVTNLETGRAEYPVAKDLRTDLVLVRASSSLPLLSRTVTVGGSRYLDGGVADPIPLAKSMADGNGRNLVVLTRHRGYRKDPESFRRLMAVRYRKYPAFLGAMAQRHTVYNRALDLVEREAEAGRAIVIRPERPLAVGRLEKDKSKLRAVYEQGYAEAADHWPAIRRLLPETGGPGQ